MGDGRPPWGSAGGDDTGTPVPAPSSATWAPGPLPSPPGSPAPSGESSPGEPPGQAVTARCSLSLLMGVFVMVLRGRANPAPMGVAPTQ